MTPGRGARQPLPEGVAPAPPNTDRLFFALLPGAPAIARIERLIGDLRNDLGLKGKPLGAARFHVTLLHMGAFPGVPRELVHAACAAAQALSIIPAFELGFDRVGSFSHRPSNMPLVLLGEEGVIAAKAFQQALCNAMARAGEDDGGGAPYTPHLTLLYDDTYVARRSIEPITWTAHEFVLVRSLIGQGRHEVLARWPLHG
ncbi:MULTISPECIES: 2'-5' RNA ligase family protein [unclassified Variovorax]|uniref:2'-5' RNA ligase family protein n=1 Tax=unclassified Variovorax TaxID=663243 RepID=UPI00076CE158|nr:MULTISPECIES: 2'-5' RNA ligase family protein [unclassified Variovorax]KWT98520.1 2',5' RNA ligase [Variovorax sp. WDL1]PNG56815.1 RNA 2',3'-cyclic phosphodiesterase [Variovorax sp. B4]PNG58239.1 RNA 2',3'-cyclic phosphodiesterase [Variovorax sp. B2]VTV09245.1 2'-5' RNA ligase [Variovorax sp. WDL1]